MGKLVSAGAMLQCSMRMTPSTLMVLRPLPLVGNMPAANIMDYIPMTNILPFGMCRSLANPTVAAATSAAMGVLTPMPCIPVCPAPWAPGAQALVMNFPALLDNCKLMCTWGGQITIKNPGNSSGATSK